MLKDLLNDQQLLDVCLTLVASGGVLSESFFEGPAGLVITAYAVMNCDDFDGSEEKGEIVLQNILSLLNSKLKEIYYNKGIIEIDVDGKIHPCT